MKNTVKNSTPKKSSDILIYLLLFLLIATGVGLGVYYWNRGRNPESTFHIEPTNEEILHEIVDRKGTKARRDLLREVRDRKKSLARELASSQSPWLKNAKNREKAKQALAAIKGFENEEGDVSEEDITREKIRLKKIGSYISDVPLMKKQIEEQENWLNNILPDEEAEIKQKTHELLVFAYDKFLAQKAAEGRNKITEFVIPQILNGRVITQPTPADYARAREIFSELNREQPTISFQGFAGFLGDDDKAKSESEGKELLGLCLSSSDENTTGLSSTDARTKEKIWQIRWLNRPIRIKFKKEFFFGRYQENWITGLTKKDDDTHTWFDHEVSWEETLETIAHELAHAAINTIELDYNGEREGGHGELHDNYTEEISQLIRESAPGQAFKEWWFAKKGSRENN